MSTPAPATPVNPTARGDVANRRGLRAAVIAAGVPCLGALLYYVILAGHPISFAFYALTKVFTLAWPLMAIFLFDRGFWPNGILGRHHLRSLPLGAVTGVFIAATILAAYAWTPLGDYVRSHADDIALKLEHLHVHTPARYIAFCVFLALAHSLLEEWFWRWYVFSRIVRSWPYWPAVVFASFAFAAHHYVVLGCFVTPLGAALLGTGVAVGGGAWCVMVHRQQTMAGAWLSHALVDVALFVAGYDIVFNR